MINQLTGSIRISSQLTKLSKITVVLLGIPIAFVIPTQTNFVWWADLIFLLLLIFCAYFGRTCADAWLNQETIMFYGFWGSPLSVKVTEVLGIRKIETRRYTYFHFKTSRRSFLVIAPMSGDGRTALFNLYNANKNRQVE